MKVLFYFIKRNTKLYFKDRGLFFSSLITPLILLILYSTFLRNIFLDNITGSIQSMPFKIDAKLLSGIADGQIVASILSVSSVTVSFFCSMRMVKDKSNETEKDLLVSPINPSLIQIGYFLSALLSVFLVFFFSSLLCLIYLSFTGFYLSVTDVFLILLDVFSLCVFGTLLSSLSYSFLRSDSQAGAVSTIISCAYGFLSGAYMPIHGFSSWLRNSLMFLPSTYGTNIIKNHALRGVFARLKEAGLKEEAIAGLKDSFDLNLYLFENRIDEKTAYTVFYLSILLLFLLYFLLHIFRTRATRNTSQKQKSAM